MTTEELIKSRRSEAWRTELRNTLKPQERMAIERVKMPELDSTYRATKLYEEVNQGLTAEQALTESHRCLDCAKPTCMEGCPVGIHIPTFIKHIEAGEVMQAARTLRETSSLPAVCGRVCPQEKQCESRCIYHVGMKKESVAIGYLERFAADYERTHPEDVELMSRPKSNGIKVAVVGSGPAGLSCAHDLAKWGYEVTVFEALHEIGGVLKYGIPEYRLPNEVVDAEIQKLIDLGVVFETNTIVGRTITYDELHELGYRALFVGSGAGLPRFMNIPGENLAGVLSSNEYLTRVNLMGAADPDSDTPVLRGRTVAVVGGGNTAMDSVRTAKRLGAERAIIIYRRTEAEMPARIEEIKHAKEEGVEFMTLHNPIEYLGDERGRLTAVRLQKMELGEPDTGGRRKPVEIVGAIETIPIDEAVVSIGVSPNPLIPRSIEGLEVSDRGTIVVNANNQSSLPDLFAGGDIVRGGATVILAMGDGRTGAAAIHKYLNEKTQ